MTASSTGAGERRFDASLTAIERATQLVERPVQRVTGSHRLNPLPHAGTISVFLLGVVIVSGLYITLFFEFGYDASYSSVEAMNEHAIQRVARALHRYSSAMLVVTTLVHAWRIFAAGRYAGQPRRWRWATGLAALVLVWLTGVTGYWLVWDIRAQALSEIVDNLVGGFGWGAELVVGSLSGTDGGSGSGTLLAIWFLHLALTVVVGWFSFRHLRRTRLAVLPPPHWMMIMGGALVFVSLLVPVEMLRPADPSRFVSDMPLDPFVLFLLPPLLSGAVWLWLAGGIAALGLVALLPKLLVRSDPAAVVIDDSACTGCDLCVVDCPYEALRLIDRTGGRPLAVVDPTACVGCGICVGSCAFGAMSMPGRAAPTEPLIVEGRTVVVACDRHDLDGTELEESDVVVRSVRCAGMISPAGLAADHRNGAASVQVVGCAPGECRYGIGNQLLSERLAGERAPRLARAHAGRIAEDWVAVGRADEAVAEPGQRASASSHPVGIRREAFTGALLVVVLSVMAAALATRAPFRPDTDRAEVRVVVDHAAGRPLVTDPDLPLADLGEFEIWVDGDVTAVTVPVRAGRSVGIVDVAVPAGAASVSVVTMVDGAVVDLASAAGPVGGERLFLQLRDVPRAVVADDGKRVFNARASGCAVCHSTEPGDDGVGPSLGGIASVAGSRVPGLDAENYLRQSILLPDQYVLEGWPAGQMTPFYRDTLSEEDLQALIAYLMTLEGDR